MIQIKEITKKRDFKKFANFPDRLYKDCPYFVPELKRDEFNVYSPETNFAFEYCDAKFFLAYQDGKIVGRIGAIVNRRANELWNQRQVRFTRVDFVDDPEVSSALFDAIEAWAKELGLVEVHGPLGFSDLDQEGMLIEGFDRMATSVTTYNYPYYQKHLEALGYSKDIDWLEYHIKVPDKGDPRVARIRKLSEKVMTRSNVRFFDLKKMNKKAIRPIVKQVFSLLSECYKDLYGVVPYTERAAQVYTDRFLPLLNPKYTKFIVDKNNKLVAFGIAAPSLAQALKKSGGRILPFGWARLLHALRNPTELELYLVAVRPDLQKSGLAALLLNEITASAMEDGVRHAESSLELEDNKKVQDMWKNFDAKQHKRRRCFKKTL